MNKIKIIGLLLICAVVVIYACKKDAEKKNDTVDVTKSTISAKWLVTGNATDQFVSFEFNKSGSYIVEMQTTNKFGDYTISGSQVDLIDFGTIVVTKLDDTQCEFVLTTNYKGTNETYNITATKAEEIPSTGNTALFCRTWSLVTMDSLPVAGTVYDLEIMFTEAGTYFVHYNILDTNLMARWQWKDNNQQVCCYSWTGTPTCQGTNEVTINKLTNAQLIMTESWGLRYELVPYTAKRSFTFSKIGRPETGSTIIGRYSIKQKRN